MSTEVSQRLVLGLMLFNLFVNDLEFGLSSVGTKTADDTKLFKLMNTKVDCEELQKALSKLSGEARSN